MSKTNLIFTVIAGTLFAVLCIVEIAEGNKSAAMGWGNALVWVFISVLNAKK